MSEVTVEDVKTKFQTLQKITQGLKEEKIGYESKLSTLQTQYDEKVNKLLEETETSSLEEAVKLCKEKKEELETLKAQLDSEISKYIDESDEEGEANEGGTLDDFFNS